MKWYKDDEKTFPLMAGTASIDGKLTDIVGSLFNDSFVTPVFYSTGEFCFHVSTTHKIYLQVS